MQFKHTSVLIVLAILAILFSLQYCSPNEESAASYLNLSDTVNYVGKQTCAQCHADKFESFLETGMGSSFKEASLPNSQAKFGSEHIIYDSALNYYYRPYWDSEHLFIQEFRLVGTDTVHNRTQKIDYIIGSGQHTNSHLFQRGELVYQAPATWYAQDGKWDLPPGFENGNNSRFQRVIDQECMSCHNALNNNIQGSNRRFDIQHFGIDCERCHGPGEAHVQFRSKGGVPQEGKPDYSIVNPSDLSWERQIDLCQRCHLQGNNVLRKGKKFEDFKPSMKLSDVFEIYLPEYDDGSSLFNMANHSDRFQQSKCFIESNKDHLDFTCISCHNPHVSVKKTDLAIYNKTCSSCHSFCEETPEKRLKVDDNCVECHMPSNGTEDIPHVTVHDHKIAIHGDKNIQKEGKVVGLYAVNNPNPSDHSLVKAYLTYYEKYDAKSIYRSKAREYLDKMEAPLLEIHYSYQERDWESIVDQAAKLNEEVQALDAYRIAVAYSRLNRPAEALEWIQLANIDNRSQFEFYFEEGSILLKANRLNDAIASLEKCLTINPEFSKALNTIGFAHILRGEYKEAQTYLEKNLGLNPDNIKAIENLILLYSRTNRAREMEELTERLHALSSKHELSQTQNAENVN